MQIILMRHAQASMSAQSDAERPLTDKGRQDSEMMADYLKNYAITSIASTSFFRAKETADIVKNVLGVSQDVITQDDMAPNGNPDSVIKWLSEQSNEVMLLVSHNPFISMLANILVSGQANGELSFGPGTFAVLETDVVGKGTATIKQVEHTK